MNEVVKDLAAFRAQAIESIGGAGVSFQPEEDGEIFTIPHPLLLDEAQNEAVEKAVGNVAVAKALLNTERDPGVHARFIAAGGRSGDVLLAWRQLTSKMNAPK